MNQLLNNEKYYQFLNSGNIAVIYMDKTGSLKFVSPVVTLITGLTENDYSKPINETVFARKYPLQCKKITSFVKYINLRNSKDLKKKTLVRKHQVEFELTGSNNTFYQANLRVSTSPENEVNGISLVFYDITKRKSTEKALETEIQKYRTIAELMDSALWEYNIKKKELKQYRKLKGKYSDSGLIIKDFRNTILKHGWVHPEDIAIFEAYCDSMDKGEDKINYDLRAMSDNGQFIWLRYQGTALREEDGKVRVIMGRTINIDREYKDHEKLVQKTERDALTGLYNRAATKEKAEKCFEQCNKEDNKDVHSFMIIDIDDFKQANDQLGHLFGDILLESFSKELEDLFESYDIVGRIGGDEFVVIQKDIKTPDQIEKSAKAICDIARKLMNSSQSAKDFTVSVGIATYPKDGNNYDILYKNADTALYFAKSQGKDQYAYYDSQMEQIKYKPDGSNWVTINSINKDNPDIEKRLLNFAFDIVNESTDLDSAINHILYETGKYYDLSRISIFEIGSGNTLDRISYEWLNKDMPSYNLVPGDERAFLLKEYTNLSDYNGIFYFNDITTAEINPDLMKFYVKLGTKALIQCAIYDGAKFIGTISYEDRIGARKWSKTERDTLFTMTKLIGSYIIQMKNKQELESEMFFSQATLDNQKLSNYAVRKGTYELLYFSEYTKTLFPAARIGKLCHKALYNQEYPCETCPLKGLDEFHKTYSIDTYNQEKDTWFSTTATSLILNNSENINLVCSADVTNFIERVTSKDSLTGLLTLSKFEFYATKLINSASDIKYLLIYSDFDKFKNINDELGYSTGNEILIEYANIANKYVRPNELFCRITSDKFVMLLSYNSRMDALERVRDSYAGISTAFNKYKKINPVITSGIYFLKQEDENISLAIDKANLARKTIKGIHKSAYAIYDESLHRQVTKEKIIAGTMYDALRNNEFLVYMQPKIDLINSKIIGAEALVRWRRLSGEILNPSEFIPIMEKNGFIDELDFYVYDKTLRTLRQWLDMGKRELIVSVNVSRIHLKDADFINRLEKLLGKYKIPSRLIELEITESMFFVELDRLEHIVNSLRSRGFLISIDDFGSGYSSLNMLKNLPIDILKLDREFFMKNEMGANDKIIISSIISLAKGLGLKVISEGVETLEQLSFLRENSCDMAQGYLFYKPMPADEFIQLLE